MRREITAFALTALFMGGCSNITGPRLPATATYEKPTPDKEKRFHDAMIKVAQSTQMNAKYHRMALNTPEEKRWFKDLMYRLWDRQITRAQFIAEGTARYPEHKYEFTYIANAYQNY